MSEDIHEEEVNLYQKVKNLEKVIEELTSTILLKNRHLEKEIKEIVSIFKKSSNNQHRIVEELRGMIEKNFKKIEKSSRDTFLWMKENNDKNFLTNFKRLTSLGSAKEKDPSMKSIKEKIVSLNSLKNKEKDT